MLQTSTLATQQSLAKLYLDHNGKLNLEISRDHDRKQIPVDLDKLSASDMVLLKDALKLMLRRSPVVGVWLRQHGYGHLVDFPFDFSNPLDTVSNVND